MRRFYWVTSSGQRVYYLTESGQPLELPESKVDSFVWTMAARGQALRTEIVPQKGDKKTLDTAHA